ncbi:hypothetical protein M0805_007849 [Coniferiporia weirii]|nr:hypothetical protein M0805_007849 [Coniferiporia weirii]
MAPYAHFNGTLCSLSVPSHTLFSPYPLYKADPSYTPSSTLPSSLPTSLRSFPHLGIGPAIIQPSPARTSKAIPAISSLNSSSPRLGYIGLAGIFVALLLLVSLFFRRRAFGCPKRGRAKRTSHARHVLRSQTARAREMEENATPRMYQLPRDRIRAMNTVPKTTPSPSERQDILEGLPCLQNSSFPPPSTPNPSSPSVTNNRFSTGYSVPPTPTTPISPVPTIDQLEPSVLSKIVRKLPEFRYTWDFRCKGLYNFALGAVLDISRANSAPKRNSLPDCGDAEDQSVDPNLRACENAADNALIPVLLTPETSPGAHGKETPEKNSENAKSRVSGTDIDHNSTMHPLLTLSPVTGIEEFVSDFSNPLSGSALSSCLSDISLISFRDESSLNTTDSALFPDVSYKSRLHQQTISRNGDGSLSLSTTTIFKTDVRVSRDSERDLLRAAGVSIAGMDAAAFPVLDPPVSPETVCSDVYASVCAEPARKRLVLSKPNHRMLTPTSSSLKIRVSPSTASGVTGVTCASSSYFSELSLPVLTSSFHSGILPNTRMGRSRAASEANITMLGRSKLVDSSACVPVKPEILSALGPTFDKHSEKKSNITDSVFENNTDALCSSISMPLCVELACLSSILKRRYKAKLE